MTAIWALARQLAKIIYIMVLQGEYYSYSGQCKLNCVRGEGTSSRGRRVIIETKKEQETK